MDSPPIEDPNHMSLVYDVITDLAMRMLQQCRYCHCAPPPRLQYNIILPYRIIPDASMAAALHGPTQHGSTLVVDCCCSPKGHTHHSMMLPAYLVPLASLHAQSHVVHGGDVPHGFSKQWLGGHTGQGQSVLYPLTSMPLLVAYLLFNTNDWCSLFVL